MSIESMNYLSPLFLIAITTGSIFILAGIILLQFPPKKINQLYGYRTKNSMDNQDRWDFSQIFSSKLLIKYGVYLALSSVLGLFFKIDEMVSMVLGLGLMFTVVFAIFINTENAIRQKFGNREV